MVSVLQSDTKSLSDLRFSPRKNYETNGLEDSVFGELPTNSNFIIDETYMKAGKIERNGVENIKAIA